VSDDLTGQTPPPQPPQAPIFVQPKPAGSGPGAAFRQPGADNWPWWYSLATLASGLVAAQIVIAILYGVWAAAGGDYDKDTAFTILATLVQEVIFVGAAVVIARMSGRVTMRDFGLVKAPLWPTVGKAASVMIGYFIMIAVYSSLVHLTADDAPDKLGAGSGVLGMLIFAVVVAVMAPIAEELLFRGMIFRSLANGMGVWGGAIVSGLIFGAFHIDSFAQSRLLQVVPLAILGILFALLYAWSGTLYSTIALHATNNSLAVLVYAADKDSTAGIVAAICIWLSMMTGCVVGWRFTDRGDDEPPEIPGSLVPATAPAGPGGVPTAVPGAPPNAVPGLAPQHPTLVAPERPEPFPEPPPPQ
jgi:membrane protease YdiL (CAAX protease family)